MNAKALAAALAAFAARERPAYNAAVPDPAYS
jgi:hypothetical protein